MQSLLDITAQVVAGEFTCAELEYSMYALDELLLKKVKEFTPHVLPLQMI